MSATPAAPLPAVGLALSGGGFRAALFHLGVIRAVIDLGLLPQIDEISSVSGGSIVAGKLALNWHKLVAAPTDLPATHQTFDHLVAEPIVSLAKCDLRNRALGAWLGAVGTGPSLGERLADALASELFGSASMGDLPHPQSLRVALNATNWTNGKRFRFRQDSYGDGSAYSNLGAAEVPLSVAVAASAAYPPVFGPLLWSVPRGATFHKFNGQAIESPYPSGMIALGDGGVYDNLGLNGIHGTNLILSDAGLPLEVDALCGDGLASRTLRTVDVLMSRIAAERVSSLISQVRTGSRSLAFVRPVFTVPHLASGVPKSGPILQRQFAAGYDLVAARKLAFVRTDLDKFGGPEVEALQVHGRQLAVHAIARYGSGWLANGVPADLALPHRELSEADLQAIDAAAGVDLWSGIAPWGNR